MYAARVTDWLSFWNQATRAENEPRLVGREVGEIYIPHGAGRVAIGDRIYCVGVEDGSLLLITRLDAVSATPDDDPDQIDSVLVRGANNGIVAAYDRTVPASVLRSLRYLRVGRRRPEPIKLTPTGDVVAAAFQGRSSIRELVQGASDLDALLSPELSTVSPVVLSVYGLLGLQLPNLAQLQTIPNLDEVVFHLGKEVSEPHGPIVPMPLPKGPRTRPTAPRKGDKISIMFADPEHILYGEAHETAFSIARGVAVRNQALGVIIQTAPVLEPETFRVVTALGHAARVSEVSLYVGRPT